MDLRALPARARRLPRRCAGGTSGRTWTPSSTAGSRFLGFIERPDLPAARAPDKDAEQSWKGYAGSMVIFSGRLGALRLPDPRAPGPPPAQPAALLRRHARARVQHGGELPHQHELAELRRRDDDVVLLPDVRARVPPVPLRRRRARARDRGHPRLREPRQADDRELLGGHDAREPLHPVPVRVRARRSSSSPRARSTRSAARSSSTTRSPASPRRSRGARTGFMEAIKQLGTNGGGFFNSNSAHPFENPTGITNFLSIVALLSIPFALTYVFGKMVGQLRQGVALLVTMVILFGARSSASRAWAEAQPNPAVAEGGVVVQVAGNMEGKEVRFGVLAVRGLRRLVDGDLDGLGRRRVRLVQPDGRLRAAQRHDARRGRARRRRLGAVHDPADGDHRRVHRRSHDRAGRPSTWARRSRRAR